jgi:hypothetical protein
VLFSRTGDERLIDQLVNFGIEKYDDLVDAFTIIIGKVIATDYPSSNSFPAITPEEPRFKDAPYPLPPLPGSEINPNPWEYMDSDEPITAGILDMKF